MARGRKAQVVEVTVDDREVLTRWSKRPKAPHSIAQRSRIVLLAADGLTNSEIARRVGVNGATVAKWRQRFADGGCDALADEPRPGAPRKIGDDRVEEIVVRTLTSRPKGSTHWSTRELAAETNMSQRTITRIWQTFGLKPWREDTFKISEDPLLIEKVRDVVGLYLDPPTKAVVMCVDEKTSIQALDYPAHVRHATWPRRTPHPGPPPLRRH